MSKESSKTMIEAKGICKYYGSFVAVEDITFAIPEGQIVAFLGPNGAGKSTTMKIITGYLAPSAGTAAIAGMDIHSERLEASKQLGYLPENGPLYLDMTPLESLHFFAETREMSPDVTKSSVERVIEQCALQEVLEKPIDKLSKGYRQRVGLAQALLHDPAVLIMDEPTAGLDPNQIREFRKNIKQLAAKKTILLSTHILQEVEAVADRVILINQGKLVFDGKPEELKEKGSLEEPFYRLTNYGRPIETVEKEEAGS
ncbi:ATP-binding cassette domain-containing protein [candidate division KSB1 bacterium]|nr:ATP-binding cassette domain-containing protein [candidate division KSB1 bacterium]